MEEIQIYCFNARTNDFVVLHHSPNNQMHNRKVNISDGTDELNLLGRSHQMYSSTFTRQEQMQ